MKNKKFIPILIIGLAVAAYFIGTSLTQKSETVTQQDSDVVVAQKPERKSEVYGKVVKLEGNLVTVLQIDISADPTIDMTPEEKQAYKQGLSEAERMAFKEQTQNATLGEVTVLVPVGIAMTKKTASGPDTPEVEGTLADISVGALLSVWLDENITDRKVAEFVKISSVVNN